MVSSGFQVPALLRVMSSPLDSWIHSINYDPVGAGGCTPPLLYDYTFDLYLNIKDNLLYFGYVDIVKFKLKWLKVVLYYNGLPTKDKTAKTAWTSFDDALNNICLTYLMIRQKRNQRWNLKNLSRSLYPPKPGLN